MLHWGNALQKGLLSRIVMLIAIVGVSLTSGVSFSIAETTPALAQTQPGRIGAETYPEFVDLMKVTRPWEAITTGTTLAIDNSGWPKGDAKTVVLDARPCCPFFSPPAYDDPDNWHEDVSGGIYLLSFTGRADIAAGEGNGFTVQNKVYNSSTNTTTAELVQKPGNQLMVIQFTNTRRLASDTTNTGITNAKLIRPGYPANTTQVFTTRYLNSIKPFSTLRFMGALDTNRNPGYYGDPGHHALEWANRHVPSDATQQAYTVNGVDKYGLAWEYIVQVANTTQKDIWINIPVAATSNYIQQLATFIHNNLNSNLKVYIEDSNEVWNFSFGQYTYNKLAAVDEVNAGGSNLNSGGSTDQEQWARRRHAKRLVETGNAFRNAFTDDTRVRPVLAWWVIQPAQYTDILNWVNTNYGAPKNYFYSIAGTGYFNFGGSSTTASVDELLAQARTNSDNGKTYTTQLVSIANSFTLKYQAYEGTLENLLNAGGDTTNMSNRVRALRDPRVQDLVVHHLNDNWFAAGGDLFMYFAAKGTNQRFGFYGATEDYNDLYGPQEQAIYAMLGQAQPNNPTPTDTTEYNTGGLTGVYYNTSNLTGAVSAIRTDARIDFNTQGSTQPFAYRVNSSPFSVRWTGQVQAPVSGNYTFTTLSDDGIRVWLDGQLIIDNYVAHAPVTNNSAAIALVAGRKYPIKIEYYNSCCGAVAQLSWSYPGQATQIIPQQYLYSRMAALDRAGWTATASRNAGTAGNAIDNNSGTRWDTQLAQSSAANTTFQVDMQKAKTFSAVSLNTVASQTDFPANYAVSVSNNGTTWTQVATGSGYGPLTTATFSQQTARYIRITLNTSTKSNWWAIHEFNVYNYTNAFTN